MKITLLKDCLLLNGIRRKSDSFEMDDVVAARMIELGVAQKYVEPAPEDDPVVAKVEEEAPAETKVEEAAPPSTKASKAKKVQA